MIQTHARCLLSLTTRSYEMIVLTQSGDETSEPFHKRNINITVPAPPRATQLMKTNESSIAIEWIPVYNAKVSLTAAAA